MNFVLAPAVGKSPLPILSVARALAAMVTLGSLGFAFPIFEARAHLGSTKYLSLSRTADGVRVAALVEVVDVAVGIGLGPRRASGT